MRFQKSKFKSITKYYNSKCFYDDILIDILLKYFIRFLYL